METSLTRSSYLSCPSDEFYEDGDTPRPHAEKYLECNSRKSQLEQTETILSTTIQAPDGRDDNDEYSWIEASHATKEKSGPEFESGIFCCFYFSSEPLLSNLRGNTWDSWNGSKTLNESDYYTMNESLADLITNSERDKNRDGIDFILSDTLSSNDRYLPDAKSSQRDPENPFASLASSTIDPYRILQIRTDATKEEIIHAYKRLAILHHPSRSSNKIAASNHRNGLINIDYDDSNLGEESKHSTSHMDGTSYKIDNHELIFTLVSVAYETLIDRESRLQLDRLQRQMSKKKGSTKSKILVDSNGKRDFGAESNLPPPINVEAGLQFAALNDLKTPRTSNNQKQIFVFPASDTASARMDCEQYPIADQRDFKRDDNQVKEQNVDVDDVPLLSNKHEQILMISPDRKKSCKESDTEEIQIPSIEPLSNDGFESEHEKSNCIVSPSAQTTADTAPITTLSTYFERTTKKQVTTANAKPKPRIHDIVKGSRSKRRHAELIHTNSSSSSCSSTTSFAISDYIGANSSSIASPIYNFINRSTNTSSGTSAEAADVIHYTSTETNRLFGGPLAILYQSRRYRYFTDPYILFAQVFHTDALTSNSSIASTRPMRKRNRQLNKAPNRCDNSGIGGQVLATRHDDVSRFPNLAAMKASSILDIQRRQAIQQMTEQKKINEKKKQKEKHSTRLIDIFSAVGGGMSKTSDSGLEKVDELDGDDDTNVDIVGWYPTPLSPSKAIVTRQRRYEKSLDGTRIPSYVQTTSRSYSDLNDSIHPPNSIKINPNVDTIPSSKRIIRTSRTYKDPRTGTVKTSITVHTEYDEDDNCFGIENDPNNNKSNDAKQHMHKSTVSTNYCHLYICQDVLSIITNSVNLIFYPESFTANN
jgi:curved DNA-binding protein CbpA